MLYTGASNTQKNSVLHLKKLPCCYFYQGTKVNIISFYRFRRSAFSVTTWHHRTLPKIPIWPKTSIIRRVWILGAFFWEKSPSYRRINTVIVLIITSLLVNVHSNSKEIFSKKQTIPFWEVKKELRKESAPLRWQNCFRQPWQECFCTLLKKGIPFQRTYLSRRVLIYKKAKEEISSKNEKILLLDANSILFEKTVLVCRKPNTAQLFKTNDIIVNVSLKFWSWNLAYTVIVLLKKCE